MNTRNPLAAALLLIAASASAQPLAGGYNFGGTNTAPFSLAGSAGAGDTDMVEKCSTVPYRPCTAEELSFRAIRKQGGCAEKDLVCQRKMMENTGTAPLQLLGNQANPSTAYDDFYKKCGTVPYRLCTPEEQKQRDAWLQSQADGPVVMDEIVVTGRRSPDLPYDQQPGFIGPPAPPSGPSMPPAFGAGEFQSELAAARSDNQYPVVDLGDNRFGVVLDDGTVSVCGRGGCIPRPASEIPDLADKIQAATSLNNGDSINKENPGGGFGPTSVPTPPGGRRSQGTPPPDDDVASNPSTEAKSSGSAAGSFFRSNGGGAAAGGTSGNSYTASAAGDQQEAIATEAAELDGVFTYIKTQQIKASIDKTAGAVTTGGDGTFVTPTTTPDANAGDLQFRGTQSGANR